jgi:hypothetical protein
LCTLCVKIIHPRPKVNLGTGMDVGAAKTGGGIENPGTAVIIGSVAGGDSIADGFCN